MRVRTDKKPGRGKLLDHRRTWIDRFANSGQRSDDRTGARIQPIRSPPQKLLAVEPSVII